MFLFFSFNILHSAAFWIGLGQSESVTCWNWDCDGDESLYWFSEDNSQLTFNDSMYFDDVRFDGGGDGGSICVRAIVEAGMIKIEDVDCSSVNSVACEVDCGSSD